MYATFIPFTDGVGEYPKPNARLCEVDRLDGVIDAMFVHLESGDPLPPHVFESTFRPLAAGFEVGTFVLEDGSRWTGIIHVTADVVRVRLVAATADVEPANDNEASSGGWSAHAPVPLGRINLVKRRASSHRAVGSSDDEEASSGPVPPRRITTALRTTLR